MDMLIFRANKSLYIIKFQFWPLYIWLPMGELTIVDLKKLLVMPIPLAQGNLKPSLLCIVLEYDHGTNAIFTYTVTSKKQPFMQLNIPYTPED